MILLNGLAPIMGATFLHIVFINVLAIIIEYFIIKRRFKGKALILRVIIANLISVLIGTIVVYTVPELLGGAIARPDTYTYSNYDKFALGFGLFCLFLTNVIIEAPAYLFGLKMGKFIRPLIKTILLANLITNIPVVFIYLWVMNGLST